MLLVTFATTVYWNGGKLGSSTVCKAWGSSQTTHGCGGEIKM